jgi:branched-chain amino acid transport system permease protein
MLSRKTAVFKTSYAADLALQRVPLARLAFWVGVAALLLLPLVAGRYWLNTISLVLIAVVATIGLNILVGYAGHISVGQGAFALVGAYTVAITSARWNVPLLIGLPLAGVVSALVGAFFGIPSLRVKGLYLAIATLAAQFILEWFVQHATWLTGLTGTIQTIYMPDPAITLPGLPAIPLSSDASRYYLFLTLTLAGIFYGENVFRTRIGRALIAVRDHDVAAQAMGINIFRYKVLAFTISAFYAGIAGAMTAYHLGAVTYEPFTITLSVQWLAMIIVGGLGSIPGAILGSVFLTILPIGLRELLDLLRPEVPFLADRYANIRDMLFGLVVLGFLILEPEGLYKLWRSVRDYFDRWPFSH